jgi:glycosyltransferase involved in cell wall biosynthesis
MMPETVQTAAPIGSDASAPECSVECPLLSCNQDGEILSVLSVAMIEPVGGHNGMHYYDYGLCGGLLVAGCSVTLYTCDETEVPDIQGLAIRPSYGDIYRLNGRLRKAIAYIARTFRSLRDATLAGHKICHLHGFNNLLPELIVIAIARLLRMSVVLTVHDVTSLAGRDTRKRALTGWLYRFADRIIVHNNTSLVELEGTGIPRGHMAVIPHGHFPLSPNTAQLRAAAREQLGIALSARVLLFFGQIKDTKGLDILIEALPRVTQEVPETLLLIAGRPWKTDFTRFEALIDKYQVRANCRLHIGYVPDDVASAYFAAADIVVLPYRHIYQSGVLLMAMSYARPVVVSDLPGMTEIVTDGENGYVFNSGSKDDLARALTHALIDEGGRSRIAAAALQYIREKHDWNHIGRTTAALYRQVLKS